MSVLELMQRRRSIRKYTGEAVAEAQLNQILQAALLAPSGRNIRPWEFIVVRNKESLRKMAASRQAGTSMLPDADCAIVVVADETKTDVWTEDCSITMAYMQLAATELGVGSCWVQGRMRQTPDGGSTETYLQQLLDIPANYKLEAILALGIPDERPEAHGMPGLDTEKIHREKF